MKKLILGFLLCLPLGLFAETVSNIQTPTFITFLHAYSYVIVLYAGLIIVSAYYLIAWFLYGRNPKQDTIVPLYQAPENLSAGACRYILNRGYDVKTFSAILMHLANKQCIKIEFVKKRKSTIARLPAFSGVLTVDEKAVMDNLFANSDFIDLRQDNSTLSLAIKAVEKSLQNQYQPDKFRNNSKLAYGGYAISALFAGIALLLNQQLIAEYFFLYILIHISYKFYIRKSFVTKFARIVSSVLMGLAFLIFLAMTIFGSSLLVSICLLALVSVNYRASRYFIQLTAAGQELRSKIKGFKMFLNLSEKDRLNILNKAGKNLENQDQYLPYVFALDVKQKWATHFDNLLTADYFKTIIDAHSRHSSPRSPNAKRIVLKF